MAALGLERFSSDDQSSSDVAMETPFISGSDASNCHDSDGDMRVGSLQRLDEASSRDNSDSDSSARKPAMRASAASKTTAKTSRSNGDASAAKATASKPRARKTAGASQTSDADKQAALAERKQASIDQRRKRNREAMQRARQRDKDYMDGLRDTARDLERKHNALLARVQERLAVISVAGGAVDPRVQELERRLQSARDQAEALKQQNLQFLDEIGDRIKREDRMEGLFRELMREQDAQQHALNEIFREALSESQVSVFYTEERAMREILRSREDKRQVERHGFSTGITGDLFGWSTQHQFQDDKFFLFSFTKTFRHQRAAHVMAQNWHNAMQMVSYRSAAEAATQHWHVVQKINDDTYLLAREVRDPVRSGEFIRLLYLRFRLDEADGSYSVVTQSVQNAQQLPLYDGIQDVWATEACMWTLFTPVLETMSDGSVQEHCQIKMVGRSSLGSELTARQNVLETILGLLRWENVNIGPMLSLTHA